MTNELRLALTGPTSLLLVLSIFAGCVLMVILEVAHRFEGDDVLLPDVKEHALAAVMTMLGALAAFQALYTSTLR